MNLEGRKIRGFIFDFDGTIIVSEHVHMRAWEDLSTSVRIDLPSGFIEGSVGLSDPQLVKILAEAWDFRLPEEEILTRKRRFYMMRMPKECAEVAGVVEMLHRIHEARFPMGIATSSAREEVLPVLERLRVQDFFRTLCTVEDVRTPKPHPEIYHLAASNLGLKAPECMAFEDSKAGVASARAAGCALVTIETLYDAETLAPAVMSVKDFTDPGIIELVRSILK